MRYLQPLKVWVSHLSQSFYAAKAKSKTVDADGFIVVTRKGRTAAEAPVVDDLKESAAKKKQEKVLTSFYRFQRREARVAGSYLGVRMRHQLKRLCHRNGEIETEVRRG